MSIITTHFKKEYSKKWFETILNNLDKRINWNEISCHRLLKIEFVKNTK